MKRWLILMYGIVAYLGFFGVFVWSVLFVGNFLIGNTLDAEPRVEFWKAMAINLGLLSLFAVQHSLMARPFFKKWIHRWIPQSAERSNYVMMSNLAMVALLIFWQPMGPAVWEVTHPLAVGLLYTLQMGGWGLLFASTCMISHTDLFGLRQVWTAFRGRTLHPLPFRTPLLYRFVRHPIYVGWLTIFWFSPVMSVGHLVFSVMCTAYILVAIQLEERDLVTWFGADYQRYRNETPMLIPGRFRRPAEVATREA